MRETGSKERETGKEGFGDWKFGIGREQVWSFREKKRGRTAGRMSIVNKYYERCLSLGLRLISGCDVLAKKTEREREVLKRRRRKGMQKKSTRNTLQRKAKKRERGG